MKRYTVRVRQQDKDIFLQIKNGQKTVETRAATIKHKNIKKGDILIFVCGNDKIEKEVLKASIFKSIDQMLKRYKIKQIMPSVKTRQEMEDICYSFPGYRDKIKEHGIIALEL